MNADQDNVADAKSSSKGVYAPTAFGQRYVFLLGNDYSGVQAFADEFGVEAQCDDTVEFVFEEAPVGAAFAWCVVTMAGIEKYCHDAVGLVCSSPVPDGKDRVTFPKIGEDC